jgi:hypothetical protein
LENQLAKLTHGADDWDEKIWKALLTIRTMVNKTTKQTPSKLLFGHELQTPAIWIQRQTDYADTVEEVSDRLRMLNRELPRIREQAARNARLAKIRQKARYDATVHERRYQPNQMVLLHVLQSDPKFASTYEGPYRIIEVRKHDTYLIQDPKGRNEVVHSDRLQPYHIKDSMIPAVADSRIHSKSQRYRQV